MLILKELTQFLLCSGVRAAHAFPKVGAGLKNLRPIQSLDLNPSKNLWQDLNKLLFTDCLHSV